jgi:dGTPase
MEACDDIAYSVLDTEDAVKKGLVSFSDVVDYLRHEGGDDATIQGVIRRAEEKYKEYRLEPLSPAELNDISMQMLRVYAIGAMVRDLTDAFEQNAAKIMDGSYRSELVAHSRSAKLCSVLKTFGLRHAYKHRSVLKIELNGHNVLTGLMDMLWEAITNREDVNDLGSDRKTPFTRYAYSRISENYRRVFQSEERMPIRYREAQLLTDMVAGMTDSYALSVFEELKAHREG